MGLSKRFASDTIRAVKAIITRRKIFPERKLKEKKSFDFITLINNTHKAATPAAITVEFFSRIKTVINIDTINPLSKTDPPGKKKHRKAESKNTIKE